MTVDANETIKESKRGGAEHAEERIAEAGRGVAKNRTIHVPILRIHPMELSAFLRALRNSAFR